MNAVLWVLVTVGIINGISASKRVLSNELPEGKAVGTSGTTGRLPKSELVPTTPTIEEESLPPLDTSPASEMHDATGTATTEDYSYSNKENRILSSEIVGLAEDGTTTQNSAQNCTDYPDIDLDVQVNSFSVTLEWTLLGDSSCVTGYVIYLDQEAVAETNESSYTIENLLACKTYNVGVEIAEGHVSTKNIKTVVPLNLNSNSVQQLSVEEDNETNKLNVTWEGPPEEVLQCVQYYYLVWWDNTNSASSSLRIDAPQTFASLNVIGCTEYHIQVTPYAGESNPGINQQIVYTISSRLPNPPRLSGLTHSGSQINLTLTSDDRSVNRCPVQQVFLNCEAQSSNFSCTVWERAKNEVVTVQAPGNRYPMSIDGLSPSTNYSCYGIVNNEAGNSSAAQIDVVTDQEVPEIELKVEPYSYSILLQWTLVRGSECITGYIIYLDDKEIDQTEELNYTITDLNACTNYRVGVEIIDEQSPVNVTSQDVTTQVTPDFNSSSVQNLTAYEDTEAGIVKVTWSEPPQELLQCVSGYSFEWQDQDSNDSLELAAPQTSANLSLVGCAEYVIRVTPRAETDSYGLASQLSHTVRPQVLGPPTIAASVESNNRINVTWETDSRDINKCDVEEIFMSCVADALSNLNHSWIVWEAAKAETISSQSDDNLYEMSLGGLSPFTNYTCYATVTDAAGNSSVAQLDVTTEQEVSSPPRDLIITNFTTTGFTIAWTEPAEVPGVLTNYDIRIVNNGPSYTPGPDCLIDLSTSNITVGPEMTTYVFNESLPYYNMTVSVAAVNGAGASEPAVKTILTPASQPDPVTNASTASPVYSQTDTYYATVEVTFDPPCHINGPLHSYQIRYTGTRPHFGDAMATIKTNDTSVKIELLPEHNYSFEIRVQADLFTSDPVSIEPFISKSGVPTFLGNVTPPLVTDDIIAYFTLNKNYFSDINGEIVAWAVFLFASNSSNGGYGFWGGTNDTWPEPPADSHQLTCRLWNPFERTSMITFAIGASSSDCCSDFCNRPLTRSADHWLMIRAFTSAAYRDSDLVYFQTEMLLNELNLGLILGITFGLLTFFILAVVLLFLWRRKQKTVAVEEDKQISVSSTPGPIPVEKFLAYYASIKDSYNILKQQYSDLVLQSKSVAGAMTYAVLAENGRKNRYTNILPFDETRVKLNIDEDDEIGSDYINASYIRGYSGKVEYIATQGPLESTTRDFWKMIVQENVSMIVMVSQFVEQSKEKCFQYFPNNHESAAFGENLEVKCSTQLHFGTYCVRTLQVRKDTEQRTIVHMQFLEWPDFGVPQGTDNMLQFCGQMRDKANSEGGVTVIHCSAGVGRTGTLIALDILLQTIDDHRDINIYKTVFDLRKQRINMVQTEKQYMFIYDCVKEYIETPTTQVKDSTEDRVYENVDILRSSLKKNLLKTKTESAF